MRDDFSEDVKRIAASRVGWRCSNPACRRPTSGPQADSAKSINLGVGSHITAASPAGPRFDSSLSAEQRKHPDNAIWLCQLCGKLIDNDPTRFTVQILRQWKEKAEAAALSHLISDAPELSMSFVNRQNIEWRITNHSNSSILNVLYYFVLFDLDQPFIHGGNLPVPEPLRRPVSKADFVNPMDSNGGLVLTEELLSLVKYGDRIFGTAELAYPGGQNKGYWLYYTQGQGGWYSQMQGHTSRGLQLQVGKIAENPDAELEKLVPVSMRLPIL